ncbi:rRNA maturation RNase YbeY [Porticoccus sp.]|uniref:rRNA maturation RNase YbeY n=1 Tax=Porticoccus sp. TaxID=2024853 RepID=UPI003F69BF04
MKLLLDIENAYGKVGRIPDRKQLRCWATAALSNVRQTAELSVRIVSEAESAELNRRYRHKEGPTNVLSFPADLPPDLELPLLGDLVVCAPVVEREAGEQHKSIEAHWAHMVVHGCLHLIGHDHIEDNDADIMEALETRILTDLGFSPPYQQYDASEQQIPHD